MAEPDTEGQFSLRSGKSDDPSVKSEDIPTRSARGRPLLPELDELNTEPNVPRAWSEDAFGTLLHKPTGTRVSPQKGIVIKGAEYRLSPDDIELPPDSFLGSGSGGVVQVGWHKPSGQRVAVKTLRVGGDEAKRELMLREISCLAQIAGCPYLIQWHAGFADPPGSVRVVLEFMDRGSLADLRERVRPNGAPAEPVACIAAQVMRGLRFLQLSKLLHRDIKPENVLHNSAGHVKLTDFGISRGLEGPASVGITFVGTATYMAPERASGESYSYESDIWSAGLVVYELAAGCYPFPHASFPELFEGLLEGPEPRLDPKAFPPELCDLVARCLVRDPAGRPDAVALCSHEAVDRVGDEDITAFAGWLATFGAHKVCRM